MGIIVEPEKLCKELSLPEVTISYVSKLMCDLEGRPEMLGRKPSVINSATVYLAALKTDQPLRLVDIEKITAVSVRSIKNTTYYVAEVLEIEIPHKHLVQNSRGVISFRLHTSACRKSD